MISGQHIAVIAPKSFNFEGLVVSGLEQLGADVRYYDERPDNSTIGKVLLRVFPGLVRVKITKHYKNIFNDAEDFKPDSLLIIRGELLPNWFVPKIREVNPRVKIYFYTADSIANNHTAAVKLNWFDRAYTFDPIDAARYDLSYLPLFYNPALETSQKSWESRKYDVSFLGTLHSDRQQIVSKSLSLLGNPKNKFLYYYSHAWWVSVYLMRYGLKFAFDQLKYTSTNPLPRNEMVSVFKETRVMLDVHHPGQNGLTHRTIEALAAGCKLITTNSNIVNEPFYDDQCIQVIDRSQPTIDPKFLTEPRKLDIKKLRYLRIDNWLTALFQD